MFCQGHYWDEAPDLCWFTPLRQPRTGYATQMEVSLERVDMMAVAMIHYGLDPGMLVRYLGGEYTGAYRDIKMLQEKLMPHVPVDDMKQIITYDVVNIIL